MANITSVIWSNYEISPFIIEEANRLRISNIQDQNVLTELYKKVGVKNLAYRDKILRPNMSKVFDNELLAFCHIFDENGSRSQDVFTLEANKLDSIFDIPYDYGTWYMNTRNIEAQVYWQGKEYRYVFRELKESKDKDLIFNNIKRFKLMLTNTYLSCVTRTVLDKEKTYKLVS